MQYYRLHASVFTVQQFWAIQGCKALRNNGDAAKLRAHYIAPNIISLWLRGIA